jgi:sugar phosphate isomerase/epimerase
MRLACQEQLLPGTTIIEKWDEARALGFVGIELRGQDGHRIRDRLPELRAARDAGVVFSSVCVEMDHFIGDFDADRRRNATDNMATQLEVIAELGGVGAVTPASWGMFSRRLPPFTPPRSEAEDEAVLVAALSELGTVAERHGVAILLEALNRYEDHMVNTLARARKLAEATGVDAVGVAADTFHMDIEEVTFDDAWHDVADRLGHVQVSDSNRLEPGAGHLDWDRLLSGLAARGYDGWLAWECRLSGEPRPALQRSVEFVRQRLASPTRG